MKLKILFLFGILTLLLGVANIQAMTYTLNGNVVDSETGAGIANAKITLSQGGVVKSVVPYSTKSDGSFEITGFTDIQLIGSISVKVESSSYFSNEVQRTLSLEGGTVDIGTITMFSLFPSQPPVTSEAIPSTLQKYLKDEDFDRVIVKSNRLYLDRYKDYDSSRITFVGTLEYYLVPMFQGTDSSLVDLVYLKPGAVVEFWKDGKKLKTETLLHDSTRELRKDCSYWIFNNKNNNRVHFDICKTSSSATGTDISGTQSKSSITGSSRVYHNGNIYSSDVNQWTCKDSASAFSNEVSSLSEADLSLLREEGKGWCNSGELSKKDFCQDNQIWGYSCNDNCGTATMIKDCGEEKLCYDSGDGATCFGTEICDPKEPTTTRRLGKLVRNVAAKLTLGAVDEAKEFCEPGKTEEGTEGIILYAKAKELIMRVMETCGGCTEAVIKTRAILILGDVPESEMSDEDFKKISRLIEDFDLDPLDTKQPPKILNIPSRFDELPEAHIASSRCEAYVYERYEHGVDKVGSESKVELSGNSGRLQESPAVSCRKIKCNWLVRGVFKADAEEIRKYEYMIGDTDWEKEKCFICSADIPEVDEGCFDISCKFTISDGENEVIVEKSIPEYHRPRCEIIAGSGGTGNINIVIAPHISGYRDDESTYIKSCGNYEYLRNEGDFENIVKNFAETFQASYEDLYKRLPEYKERLNVYALFDLIDDLSYKPIDKLPDSIDLCGDHDKWQTAYITDDPKAMDWDSSLKGKCWRGDTTRDGVKMRYAGSAESPDISKTLPVDGYVAIRFTGLLTELMSHEFGHCAFDLDDEYTFYEGGMPSIPHASKLPYNSMWNKKEECEAEMQKVNAEAAQDSSIFKFTKDECTKISDGAYTYWYIKDNDIMETKEGKFKGNQLNQIRWIFDNVYSRENERESQGAMPSGQSTASTSEVDEIIDAARVPVASTDTDPELGDRNIESIGLKLIENARKECDTRENGCSVKELKEIAISYVDGASESLLSSEEKPLVKDFIRNYDVCAGKCSDSDRGIHPLIPGTITYLEDGREAYGIDTCIPDSNSINEFYCDYNCNLQSVTMECEDNLICVDGNYLRNQDSIGAACTHPLEYVRLFIDNQPIDSDNPTLIGLKKSIQISAEITGQDQPSSISLFVVSTATKRIYNMPNMKLESGRWIADITTENLDTGHYKLILRAEFESGLKIRINNKESGDFYIIRPYKIIFAPINWKGGSQSFLEEANKQFEAFVDFYPLRDCSDKAQIFTIPPDRLNCNFNFGALPDTTGSMKLASLSFTQCVSESKDDLLDILGELTPNNPLMHPTNFQLLIGLMEEEPWAEIGGFFAPIGVPEYDYTVIVTTYLNEDDDLKESSKIVLAHEVGHMYGLREEYTSIEDRSKSPFGILAGEPNPLRKEYGCDPTPGQGCCGPSGACATPEGQAECEARKNDLSLEIECVKQPFQSHFAMCGCYQWPACCLGNLNRFDETKTGRSVMSFVTAPGPRGFSEPAWQHLKKQPQFYCSQEGG